MKLYIEKEKMSDSPANFLRSEGYGYLQGRGDKQDSFARRLAHGAFPRLHMYVNDRGEKWEFHLHMDQKAASYKGVSAHSGEYAGPILEAEIGRLAQSLGVSETQHATRNTQHSAQNKFAHKKKLVASKSVSAEDRLGHGSLGDVEVADRKKSFWRRFF